MEDEITDTNDQRQAEIEALDKELNKKMQECKVKETEVKQLLEFKAESIKVNRDNETKVTDLEKAIIDSNKSKSELKEKSKSKAQQITQYLSELEKLNEQNLAKVQDIEMKQKELITLKEKDKEIVANLSQHVVKIK